MKGGQAQHVIVKHEKEDPVMFSRDNKDVLDGTKALRLVDGFQHTINK